MDPAEQRILDAAERLFYKHGITRVSVQEIRAEAGVSLKFLYSRHASKDDIAEAYLRTRHERWIREARSAVGSARPSSSDLLRAFFDWLDAWFRAPDFNGCAFTNARHEAATLSPGARAILELHSQEIRRLLTEIAETDPLPTPDETVAAWQLLVEGAIAVARATPTDSRSGDAGPARTALTLALRELQTATTPRDAA